MMCLFSDPGDPPASHRSCTTSRRRRACAQATDQFTQLPLQLPWTKARRAGGNRCSLRTSGPSL